MNIIQDLIDFIRNDSLSKILANDINYKSYSDKRIVFRYLEKYKEKLLAFRYL